MSGRKKELTGNFMVGTTPLGAKTHAYALLAHSYVCGLLWRLQPLNLEENPANETRPD